MSRVKTSLDQISIRRLIWLVLTVFVLLGYSLQSVAGSAYYSNMMQNYATVSSPPVILQNGTAGTSTIYANNTSVKTSVEAPLFDYVDNNDPDVDSSADKGTHSNFPAQQSGPDSTYDTLAEENTEAIEDYVDNISDVDNSPDVGIHSNFENQKAKDLTYDNLTEVNTGGTEVAFNDTFTDTNGVLLNAHSPSPTGTGWTLSVQTGTQTLEIQSNQVTPTGLEYNTHLIYTVDDTPSSNEYNVTVTSVTGSTTDDDMFIVGRYMNSSYMYAVAWSTTNGFDLAKIVGGVETILDSTGTMPADGSVITLEITDAYKKVYDDGVEILSSTDNVITGTGKGGLGCGQLVNTGADIGATTQIFDDFQIVSGGGEDNYELDLEVQFTAVIDFLPTEKLCIYTGTFSGTEDINIDFWNGTGWENLATDLTAFICNQYTVSLTSTTFTIRFKGGNEIGDTTQDQWQIDASLLRVEDAGSKEDVVDQQSNVDGSADFGTHSNFTALQYGPDSINDTLTEENTGVFSNSTLLDDGFEAVDWDANWDAIAHNWQEDNNPVHSGSASAWAEYGNDGDFTCDDLNASGASAIYVDFWYQLSSTETDDLVLYYYDGSVYDEISQIGGGTEDTWLHYTAKVTDSQYFISNFRIRFNAGMDFFEFEDVWVDDVLIKKEIQSADNYEVDLEVRWTDLPHSLPNEELCIYAGTMGAEDIKVDVWNGSSWINVVSDMNASDWNNVTITSYLTSSNFTIRFKGGTETGDTNQDIWNIDVALIHVWNDAGENYELDLEVQWTSADYSRTNEELCIKTGTFSGSENIQVKVWNNTGSSWHWVMNLTASQWNNVSITSYLTSSTFTVQFLGGTETGDTTQDNWNIDATLLHVWTSASTWLSGWDKRVKITIDHNDIDSNLSNSPVLVYLSNSSGRNNDDVTFVFDEVGSNRKKIAVTKSDGTTQCYVEIEKWDNASEQAWLRVKVPSISSTADTDLYLYYDGSQSDNTAYVGDKESAPAQNVWNTSFKGVWHLDEDPSGTAPQMRDSTSNNNDGTSNGNMTSGDQIAGKIDGSLDFDGTDDYIQTTSSELKTLDNFTLCVWFKADSTTAPQHILWEGPASQNGWGDGSSPSSHEMHLTICKFDANNTLNFFYGYEESGDWAPAVEINMSFSDTTNWNHAVVVMTGAGTSPSAELFLNGVSQGTDTGTQTNRTAWDTNLRIGRPGADQRYFDGMIDEVRILETARSAGWIKASYESGRDDLLDFGTGASEGTSEDTYDYVLRVNNTGTDSWQIRLKKYADSNISRLQNCTIYFHNSTDGTSNQIIIENGSYINQTGLWYDLGDSETIYIAMTVNANSAATSYVYTYLEIRTPNTTTYAQYVITFEIT